MNKIHSYILLVLMASSLTGCDDPQLSSESSRHYEFYGIYANATKANPHYEYSREEMPSKQVLDQVHQKCRQIPENEGRKTIMAIEDKQIYFHRSACLYDLALYTRDKSFCKEVVEAKHFFYNGSRYSPTNCEKQIEILIHKDELFLKYQANPENYIAHKPIGIEAQPLSNGDYEIIVESEGHLLGEYTTSVFVLPVDPKAKGSSQLEPLRIVLKLNKEKSIFVIKANLLKFPDYQKGFKIKASFIGPTKMEGEDTSGVFSTYKTAQILISRDFVLNQ